MRVGVYGGTFDPPHLGHMRAAQGALALLELDELILIPAKHPPHKELSHLSAPAEHRLAMVSLMADGMGDPRVSVSAMELEREGRSYTAHTLASLRAQRPQDEFFLLMGSDMYLSLQDWYDPQAICDLAVLAPFSRTGEDGDALRSQEELLSRAFGARTRAVALPRITRLSSTELRGDLSPDALADGLWCQVYGYILRHGLYGVEADLKNLTDGQLRAASYSMVRAKRIPHIRGCEEEAVRLAMRWGADPELCRRAAILHDCTKYLEWEEHRALCNQYGVELDDLEYQSVKLLHSKTGALIARHVFGQCDAIYDAIFCHTTGRAGMSLMDKVLYMADYMEPTRDFPGVEELRKLAYEDLDAAMCMGARLTMAEMKEKKREIHPNTLACYEELSR